MGSFSSFEGHYDSAFFLTCYFLFDIPTLFYWMSSGWDAILQCNFVAIIFTVLVGYRETAEPSSRLVHARVLAQVLCQVLHAGSQPHWGRVHQVPFWPTDQTRFGNGSITMQRQYGSSHGLIHCPRYSFTFSLFSQIRSITCQYVVQGEEDIVIYVTYRKKGGKLEWQARSARASLRSCHCHIAWIMYVNHVMFPMWTLLGKEMGSAITRTWFLITFTEAVTHVRYISVVHWYVSIVHAALHALFCRLRNKPEYWDYQSHGKKGKNDNYIEHILSSIFQLNVVITW